LSIDPMWIPVSYECPRCHVFGHLLLLREWHGMMYGFCQLCRWPWRLEPWEDLNGTMWIYQMGVELPSEAKWI
jgi:hypothetical protein